MIVGSTTSIDIVSLGSTSGVGVFCASLWTTVMGVNSAVFVATAVAVAGTWVGSAVFFGVNVGANVCVDLGVAVEVEVRVGV